MRVVNDIAEHGVALMDEYNKLHTTDEEQKQFLLLVVKDTVSGILTTAKRLSRETDLYLAKFDIFI